MSLPLFHWLANIPDKLPANQCNSNSVRMKVDIILSNKEKCQQGATQVKNAV